MTILTTYLQRMSEIRRTGSGVKETSFYETLETLLNEVGKDLKPRVRCVINLKNRGAGLPNGRVFTASQIQKSSDNSVYSLPWGLGTDILVSSAYFLD